MIRKQYEETETTIGIIFDILEIIKPVDALVTDVFRDAELGFRDFKDAIVAAIAQRKKADYIMTRNTADFSKSSVPAITPDAFLSMPRR